MEVAGNKRDNENELHNDKKIKETCRRNLELKKNENAIHYKREKRSPLMMDKFRDTCGYVYNPKQCVVSSGKLK